MSQTSESPVPAALELFTFDDDGDVILVVHNELRLRVSSKQLSVASKVFAAMFMEGQSLSTSSPPEILLPEDDASGLRTLCEIFYHIGPALPSQKQMSPEQMLNLIVAADKYDCVRVTDYPLRLHIRSYYDSLKGIEAYGWRPRGRESFSLLAIAYVLRDKDLFRETSAGVVLQLSFGSTCELVDLQKSIEMHLLPDITLLLLEAEKNRIRRELFTRLRLAIKENKDKDPETWMETESAILEVLEDYMDEEGDELNFGSVLDLWDQYGLSTQAFLCATNNEITRKIDELLSDHSTTKRSRGVTFLSLIRKSMEDFHNDQPEGLCLKCFEEDDCYELGCNGLRHTRRKWAKREPSVESLDP